MRVLRLSTVVLAATLLAGVLLVASAVQGMTDVDRHLQQAALRTPDRMLVEETGVGGERAPWCDGGAGDGGARDGVPRDGGSREPV